MVSGRSILGNTIQYVTFNKEENYLLIVSQQKDRIVHPRLGHNVILTATSYSEETNQRTAKTFQRETGIELGLDVPEDFRKMYDGQNISFKVFERDPDFAMKVLTGRLKR